MGFQLGQIRYQFRLFKDLSESLAVALHALLHIVAAIVAVQHEPLRILGEFIFPRSRACGIRVELVDDIFTVR